MTNVPPTNAATDAIASDAVASHPATDAGTQNAHSLTGVLCDTDARRIDITIPSNAEFVRVVRLALLGVASRMNFSFDDVEDIKLALSEACNNAILHSQNDVTEDARIVVSFVPYSNRLEIFIADEGRVPPPGLPRPRHPLGHLETGAAWHDLPEGGLGLFLMQSLMDKVQHRTGADANPVVQLVKYLPGQKPSHLNSSFHTDGTAPQLNHDGSAPAA